METKTYDHSAFKGLATALQDYSAGVKQLKALAVTIRFMQSINEAQRANLDATVTSAVLGHRRLVSTIELTYDEILELYIRKHNKLSLELDELYVKLVKVQNVLDGKKEVWYFTFGFGHITKNGAPLRDVCVAIEGEHDEARKLLIDIVGSQWANQYETPEAAGVGRHYETAISLGEFTTLWNMEYTDEVEEGSNE